MNKRNFYSILKDQPEVLTVPEAAKILRIGKNKAYELIKNGKLSSIQLGRKTIIPKACLIDFLINDEQSAKKSKKSRIVPQNVWTYTQRCAMLRVADGDADCKKISQGGKV